MYDPALLRTFLAVDGLGGFTAAAAQLGLSQPTVSQQVRKLEEAVGRPLFARDTHTVRLTEAGEALTRFARSILAAHAEAEAYFGTAQTRGRLRFGAADDLAITQLPRILRFFRQQNPQVDLELTVDQSGTLVRRLGAGHLDLVLVKQPATEPAEGDLVLRDEFVWVGQEPLTLTPDDVVPLILDRSPSFTRRMVIDALESAGRRWRVACTVRDVSSMIAATRAGLGISVFAHSLIPDDLTKVSVRLALPALGDVDFRLLSNPAAPAEAVRALSIAIRGKTLGLASTAS